MKLFMKGNTLKMNPLGAIELTGMEFHAYHGCLESERTEGNTFIVDFLGHAEIRMRRKAIRWIRPKTTQRSTG